MKVEIENIIPFRIAYLRQTGPYGQDNVKIMEQLKLWAHEKELMNEQTIILGIARDNPEIMEKENCRYDTCLVISEDYIITDASVMEDRILGGKYAVFLIDHTAEAVQQAWLTIFPEIARLNYQFDTTRPILERYKVKLVQEHFCEICIPVC